MCIPILSITRKKHGIPISFRPSTYHTTRNKQTTHAPADGARPALHHHEVDALLPKHRVAAGEHGPYFFVCQCVCVCVWLVCLVAVVGGSDGYGGRAIGSAQRSTYIFKWIDNTYTQPIAPHLPTIASVYTYTCGSTICTYIPKHAPESPVCWALTSIL